MTQLGTGTARSSLLDYLLPPEWRPRGGLILSPLAAQFFGRRGPSYGDAQRSLHVPCRIGAQLLLEDFLKQLPQPDLAED